MYLYVPGLGMAGFGFLFVTGIEHERWPNEFLGLQI